MDKITYINESMAFLTASTIAHYYFCKGYHVNISAKVHCKEVDLSVFTDDGQLPELPAGLQFSTMKIRELHDKEIGTFFAHRFTFEF